MGASKAKVSSVMALRVALSMSCPKKVAATTKAISRRFISPMLLKNARGSTGSSSGMNIPPSCATQWFTA